VADIVVRGKTDGQKIGGVVLAQPLMYQDLARRLQHGIVAEGRTGEIPDEIAIVRGWHHMGKVGAHPIHGNLTRAVLPHAVPVSRRLVKQLPLAARVALERTLFVQLPEVTRQAVVIVVAGDPLTPVAHPVRGISEPPHHQNGRAVLDGDGKDLRSSARGQFELVAERVGEQVAR
jgi:hypothetical protein